MKMKDLRKEKKKVLILGAGYVTPPVVDYLISKGHHVSLVSAIEGEANNLGKSKRSRPNALPA